MHPASPWLLTPDFGITLFLASDFPFEELIDQKKGAR